MRDWNSLGNLPTNGVDLRFVPYLWEIETFSFSLFPRPQAASFVPYLWEIETTLGYPNRILLDEFVPYLWEIETSKESYTSAVSGMAGLYLTYERLKRGRCTQFKRSFFKVCTLPMRDWNIYARIVNLLLSYGLYLTYERLKLFILFLFNPPI